MKFHITTGTTLFCAFSLLACSPSRSFHQTIASISEGLTASAPGGLSPGGTPAAALPTFGYDLDQDGVNESDIKAGTCASGPCLLVTSKALNLSLQLPLESGATVGKIAAVGRHSGGILSDVAVYYNDSAMRPTLAVFDLRSSVSFATAKAPVGSTDSYYDFAAGPGGKKYAFMVPPDGTELESSWTYACIYSPGAKSPCGNGFAAVSITPSSAVLQQQDYFREVGGYLQDIDGDGWEDINIIYHYMIHTISPRTLAAINTTAYDVANPTGPVTFDAFHSGRNYGTHAAITSDSGKLRDVIVGGTEVGLFSDAMCNVSRFVGVVESDPGQPATRHLAWADYFSFHSNGYAAYDPALVGNTPVVTRPGAFEDKCIHRYSDSRTRMDGKEVILVDYFKLTQGVSNCVNEQYGYYFGITDPWYACANSNLKSRGTWGMQVISEADGGFLTGAMDNYIWAWSDQIYPGGDPVYLVETLSPDVSFDLSDVVQSKLSMRSLHNGSWVDHGSLPIAGRPAYFSGAVEGARGAGSSTSYMQIYLRDRDGDGLMDFEMSNGTWVGWSQATQSWVVKK